MSGAPRKLSDTELDRICAKGSVGASDHLIPLREILFDFGHIGLSTQVTGSGRLLVESNTNDPSRIQISSGDNLPLTKTPQGGFAHTVNGTAFRGIQIRAGNAAVRVTADFDLAVQSAAFHSLRNTRDNSILRPASLLQSAAAAGARRGR